jgi:hypothetical protein
VMWSGLDLKPRNLFDRTPFYPYPPPPPAAPQARARGAGADDDDAGRAGATAIEPAPNRTAPDQRK